MIRNFGLPSAQLTQAKVASISKPSALAPQSAKKKDQNQVFE